MLYLPALPIIQTYSFKQSLQKLPVQQKLALDDTIKDIVDELALLPEEPGVVMLDKVYKFKTLQHFTTLVYQVDNGQLILTQLMLGTNNSFYHNIKWNFVIRGKLISLFFAWGSIFKLNILSE